MTMWQAGDIAIAVRDATCGCGGHHVQQRTAYKVAEVVKHPLTQRVFLRVDQMEHFFAEEYFRRETKATTDIFKLAKAPQRKREEQPA